MPRVKDTDTIQHCIDMVHEEIVKLPAKLWQHRARRVMVLARDRLLAIQERGEALTVAQEALLEKANAVLGEDGG